MRGKYFTEQELSCKHCGENRATRELCDMLDEIREELNRPVRLTSASRCEEHDKASGGKGRHQTGNAADIEALTGAEKYAIVKAALLCGATGIGVGANFVHVDCVPSGKGFPVPAIWTYGG